MTNITRAFELMPLNGRKSFYGKAAVIIDSAGNYWLRSYSTVIAVYDHNKVMHRLWGGWSLTSGSHFAAFCDYVGEMNWREAGKTFWDSLEVEDVATLRIPD